MVMAGRGGGGSGGRERGAFCCCSADAAEQPLLAWLVRGSAGWRSHVTLDGSGAAVLRLSSSHIDSINASQTHIHVHGISELEAFSHSFKFYTRLRQSSSYKGGSYCTYSHSPVSLYEANAAPSLRSVGVSISKFLFSRVNIRINRTQNKNNLCTNIL